MHAATAHLPVTQLQPWFNCSGPLHESGFVPRRARPWSPSQALSPPAGVLHNESVLWIRSTSANPSAVFPHSYVCVQGRCDSTRHAF